MKRLAVVLLLVLGAAQAAFPAEEGTRHITGPGKDIYFMNDKVFGTLDGHPVWAVYDCGTEIRGEIDIRGVIHRFHLTYPRDGDRVITGSFGALKMSLGKLAKREGRVVYPVQVGDKAYAFTIRYEKMKAGHMVNSIIEGRVQEDRPLTLTVDGALCPFATTGIVMMIVGSEILKKHGIELEKVITE